MEIAQALKQWRESRGLSQNAVAKAANIPQQTYNRWENGQRIPNCEQIKQIAETFRVSVDELLGVE